MTGDGRHIVLYLPGASGSIEQFIFVQAADTIARIHVCWIMYQVAIIFWDKLSTSAVLHLLGRLQ